MENYHETQGLIHTERNWKRKWQIKVKQKFKEKITDIKE